jgi:hypothetical protein
LGDGQAFDDLLPGGEGTPTGPNTLKLNFLVVRYSAYAMIFLTVVIALSYGPQGNLFLPSVFLLAGALAGTASLHLAWGAGFRTLTGAVAVASALWAQINETTPFYAGWAVLLLGIGALLIGGLSLETRYLLNSRPGGRTAVGAASLRRMALTLGGYLVTVMVVGLVVMIASLFFILGSFPLWAVGVTTAGLVLILAYLVSKSAEAADQSG